MSVLILLSINLELRSLDTLNIGLELGCQTFVLAVEVYSWLLVLGLNFVILVSKKKQVLNPSFWMTGCLDGPSQVKISKMQGTESLLEHGETLSCVSDGNPSPVYTWWDATTGRQLDGGQQLTFDMCRHLSCDDHCIENNTSFTSFTAQCMATVSGLTWVHSDNANTTFFVDLRLYNKTCGTAFTIISIRHLNK